MQDKKIRTEMALLSVPIELLSETEIKPDGILEMYADGNRLVIQNMDDSGEFVCSGDCENCPMSEIDCDGECADCPCFEDCDEAEVNENE